MNVIVVGQRVYLCLVREASEGCGKDYAVQILLEWSPPWLWFSIGTQ